MAKKITAALISLLLLISAVPQLSGAQPQITKSDRKTNCEELLFAAGILDAESYSGEAEVTRGDFINAAVRLYNLGELASGNTIFSDVSDNDERKGAISFAADRKIISGFGDGSFRPDDILQKEQAAKILMSLLGYDVYAQAYGGYPGGYLTVATMQGLFKGVTVGDYKECTWDTAAKMLYNALFIDIVETQNDKQVSKEGNNPLTAWLKIYEAEGMLSENSITLSKDSVKIEDKIYTDTTNSADQMLGFPVLAYYKLNMADDKEIIFVNRKFHTEYIIAAEDINPATTDKNIVYEDVTKSESVAVDSNPFFVKNFEKQEITSEKLKPKTGYMVAADTDGNGSVDVISVFETETYVVDDINKTSYVIKDLYSNEPLKLELDNKNIDISISGYGGAKSFSDIKENDVLTVCKSDKYIDIYVSTVKIKGEVSEKTDNEIKIGDKYYKMLSTAKSAISDAELGKVATLYIDKNGFVAGVRASNLSSKEYGFLIALAPEGDSRLKAPAAEIRLFKMDGEIETFITAEEVTVNGSLTAPADGKWDGEKITALFTDGGKVVNQLISYGVDENNQIFKIDTAVDNTLNVGTEENKFSLDFDYPAKNDANTTLTSLVYNDVGGGSLSHQVGLSGTKVLSVPKLSGEEQMIDREREIRFVEHNVEYLGKRLANFKAYDMDESLNAAVLVVESDTSSSGGDIPAQPFVIVDKVVETIGADGLDENVMYAWSEGKYEKYYFHEELPAEDKNLQRGDVIRIVKGAGKIKKITKIFTFKGVKGERVTASDNTGYIITSGFAIDKNAYDDWLMEKYAAVYNTIYRMNKEPQWEQLNIALHCKAVKAAPNYVVVSVGKDGVDNKKISFDSKAAIIKYDEVTDTLSKASFADINPDDASQSLLLRINYSSGSEIYIIDRRSDAAIPWGGYANYGAGR